MEPITLPELIYKIIIEEVIRKDLSATLYLKRVSKMSTKLVHHMPIDYGEYSFHFPSLLLFEENNLITSIQAIRAITGPYSELSNGPEKFISNDRKEKAYVKTVKT